ncbi:hypothetical protein B0H17DRAFT_1290658 [Mycena rosella]|uniref:Uncharacterized protein n=1 Tax=Mycena rosella TaxID=1033263 RepID=A0AAD7DEW0_MYCRO|nr:hypothetical protein B0H17DRAFT_1290658 [Mycena rosella]
MPLPLAKTSSKPDKSSSRIGSTLRRKQSDAAPPAQAPPSSPRTNVSGESSRRPRQLRRVDNTGNTREQTPSSSSHAGPSSPSTDPSSTLANLFDALATASVANAVPVPSSSADVPTIQIDPPSRIAPESTFLAQKLHSVINALPALSSRFLSPWDAAPAVAADAAGRPVPLPGAARTQDPELISLLSNPAIMNGSESDAGDADTHARRQSVWSALEAIPPLRSTYDDTDYAGSDRSSVMMYSPLIPTADSVIELAELEDAPPAVPGSPPAGKWLALWPAAGWAAVWPFTGWKTVPVEEHPALTDIPALNPIETAPAPAPVLRVWVPSATQLSFETMWWDTSRPPVLALLDEQSVETAQQATTLTAALTWVFSNLPIAAFPPPLQPAMLLLQRLIPSGSYIGTFVSWSWGTIRGFNRGHGVILPATWLLPIALIPGTFPWNADIVREGRVPTN